MDSEREKMNRLTKDLPNRDNLDDYIENNVGRRPNSLGGSRLGGGTSLGNNNLDGSKLGGSNLGGGLGSNKLGSNNTLGGGSGLSPRSLSEDTDYNSYDISDDSDDALFNYTPTRTSKEKIEANKSVFANAKKDLNKSSSKSSSKNKSKKDLDDINDIDDDYEIEEINQHTKSKSSNKKHIQSQPKQDDDDDNNADTDTNKNNKSKNKTKDNIQTNLVKFKDKVMIIFVCLALIVCLYASVKYLVVEQLYKPTSQSTRMNPVERLIRTMRGEDTLGINLVDKIYNGDF